MASSKKVRVAVMRTAGTNCDVETVYAFEKAGAVVEGIHINRFVEGKRHLEDFHILAFPGGFSYGDDIASGKLLANEIQCLLADAMRKFVDDGKLIIGICNGFQVLVKSGLLPGIRRGKIEATLTHNDSGRFETRWTHLRADSDICAFVKPGEDMYLPVAHGEGKFVADAKAVKELNDRGMVVFRYVDAEGETGAAFPDNPNGSVEDIAGICDPTGRIFGLMPHPERHVEPTQHPQWTRLGLAKDGEGAKVFRNAVEFARDNLL
jgi:phosphoribosylformylglycinamidine synthase subunit PurQ / glutaminase